MTTIIVFGFALTISPELANEVHGGQGQGSGRPAVRRAEWATR